MPSLIGLLNATVRSQPPRTQKVREITSRGFDHKNIFSDRSPGGHSNVLEKRSDESWRLEKYSQVYVS
jgi:hypothetical protein